MRVLRVSHSAVVSAWRARERALGALGHDVTLLTAKVWNEAGADVPLVPDAGEAVAGISTIGRHPALFVYDPRPLWRALAEPWDVLDIHEEPFSLAAAEVLLLRAVRRQLAPYALYSAQNIDKRYPIPFRWLERCALRHAAGLSVCNSEAGRICQRKGFPGSPTLLPLGLDTGHFTPAPAASSGWPIRVGYAGRLEVHKGVDVLLEALVDEPGLTLTVAGSGPEEVRLRDLATRLGIQGRVTWRGAVSQEDLPDFYRSLSVLAVPSLPTASWLEQFGRVAVEAMACGVPVIASDTGALPDVVAGAGRLVPPGDAHALRQALVAVGSRQELASRMRADGLVRAASCDWREVARRQAELYEAMTHGPLSDALPGVEVVLVAYGVPQLVRTAVEPLRAMAVTVVDNSSMAEIRAICEEVGCRYLDPGRNGGFAAGVNVALRNRQIPDGDLLLLNPDAQIVAGDVLALQQQLRAAPDLASVGPAQVDGSGVPARVGWPFPTPWGTWLEAIGLGRLRRRDDFVIGSVLLLRAEALRQVGEFDEGFFLYAEETDWAKRASMLSWRHAVVPTLTARHEGGATSTDPERREAHFHASQERYLRKHFGAVGWQVARLGQLAGSLARSQLLSGARRVAARRRAQRYARGPARAEARAAP